MRRHQPLQSSTFICLQLKGVRRFTWLQAWEPFFGSDFSYQDFSFLRLEPIQNSRAFKFISPYYSKVATLVATASGLPVERDYYDLTGKLYKIERYEQIVNSSECSEDHPDRDDRCSNGYQQRDRCYERQV